MQQLSVAEGLSGDAGTHQPISLSSFLLPRITGQIDLRDAVAVHRMLHAFFMTICSFRGRAQLHELYRAVCALQLAAILDGTNVCGAALCQLYYLHINCQEAHGVAAVAKQPWIYNG